MNSKAENIRQQMLQVRTDIDDDVDELVVAAKTFVDWKEYVRSAPWATAGLAVAMGYLAVPKKSKTPDRIQSLADMGESVSVANVVRPTKPSMLKTMIGSLAATTARLALAQIGKHATAMLAGNVGDVGQGSKFAQFNGGDERKDSFQDSRHEWP